MISLAKGGLVGCNVQKSNKMKSGQESARILECSDCSDFYWLFLEPPIMTRCDKTCRVAPSCPPQVKRSWWLKKTGESMPKPQEQWEEISWIKPCCIPVEVIHVLCHWILNLLQHVAMPAKRTDWESKSMQKRTVQNRQESPRCETSSSKRLMLLWSMTRMAT